MADAVETFEIGTDTAAAIAVLQFLTVTPTNPAKYPDTWATANARINAVLIKSLQKALKQLIELTDGTRPVIKLKIGSTGNFLTMGSGAPSGGSNGDFHLRTADGTFHAKVGGAWGEVGAGGADISPIDTSGMTGVVLAVNAEGNLTDSSGNGYNLSAVAGSEYWTIDGKQGVYSWVGQTISQGGDGSFVPLQLLGAMTLHVLVHPYSHQVGTRAIIAGFIGSGDTETKNALYDLDQGLTGQIESFHEYSGGSDVRTVHKIGMRTGQWHLLTLTRSSGTAYKFYLDGIEVVSSTTAQAPTGGTSAQFQSTDFQGLWGGAVVCNVEQNAAAVLAVAQQVGVAA